MDTDIADNSYTFSFYWLDYSARDALSLLTSYIGYAHKEKRQEKIKFGLFFLTYNYGKEDDSFTVSSPELWIKLFWLLSASLLGLWGSVTFKAVLSIS